MERIGLEEKNVEKNMMDFKKEEMLEEVIMDEK